MPFPRFVLRDVEVVWAVRDGSISSTFVDPGAAEFLLPQLQKDSASEPVSAGPGPRRWRYDAAGGPIAASGFTLRCSECLR